MRKAFQLQLALTCPWLPLEHARELQAVSDLLDANPRIAELIQQDLQKPGVMPVGANGMAADQVVRALLVMRMNGFSYRQLEFHLADSQTYNTFCRLGLGAGPSRSSLAANIKKLKAETIDQINRIVLQVAKDQGVEDGRVVRGDCTVTETLMHPPTDSASLVDSVRVLTRLVAKARSILGKAQITLVRRNKRAKRRAREIATSQKVERTDSYKDLFKVAREVISMAEAAGTKLEETAARVAKCKKVKEKLDHFLPLVRKILDQAERRVLNGESIPSQEKIVSLFEEDTDILKKSWQETEFGHKVCLVIGRSSMVLAAWVLDGNPADVTLTIEAIKKTSENMARVPEQVVFDGAFKSLDNLEKLKEMGVQDVAFSKHRGMSISQMVRSTWLFQKLRDFRAGIEGCISFLKRGFGLDRCTWRSFESFKAYVATGSLACNLLVLARARP